ncbi:MAG: hypothetical protein IPL78_00920 [Chloroflexi bacterium]|nr:hypothetical protein [Chloroflexota bacterium]
MTQDLRVGDGMGLRDQEDIAVVRTREFEALKYRFLKKWRRGKMGKIRQTQDVKEYDQQTYAYGAAMEVHKMSRVFWNLCTKDALEIN